MAVLFNVGGELAAEVLADVIQPCGGREAAARTDDDMVGLIDGVAQEVNSFRIARSRFHCRYL